MRHLLGIVLVGWLAAGTARADNGEIDVLDFGAKADATTDNTAAFQQALDKAAETGATVRVPPGQYRIDGVLTIPASVTLEGAWPTMHTTTLDKGTTLFAYAGRDKEDSAPFISLKPGATLKGVTIYYPEQKVNDIHAYPWTIRGQGPHCNVVDVAMGNSYNGIDVGTLDSEGHHLRNVSMCALRKGVYIDHCADIGRVENVHIHNKFWWQVGGSYATTPEEVQALNVYTKKYMVGFIIGRTDWEYMSNCFVIWCDIGFHFIESQHGTANALITQSGGDDANPAVLVDKLQPHAGIAFENCQFLSAIEIGPENEGPVKFTNCGIFGRPPGRPQLWQKGKGTVTMNACHFSKWDYYGTPCIRATGGTLILTGCDFMHTARRPDFHDSQHIVLEEGVKSAVIMGNHFYDEAIKIQNASKGEVEILANVKSE